MLPLLAGRRRIKRSSNQRTISDGRTLYFLGVRNLAQRGHGSHQPRLERLLLRHDARERRVQLVLVSTELTEFAAFRTRQLVLLQIVQVGDEAIAQVVDGRVGTGATAETAKVLDEAKVARVPQFSAQLLGVAMLRSQYVQLVLHESLVLGKLCHVGLEGVTRRGELRTRTVQLFLVLVELLLVGQQCSTFNQQFLDGILHVSQLVDLGLERSLVRRERSCLGRQRIPPLQQLLERRSNRFMLSLFLLGKCSKVNFFLVCLRLEPPKLITLQRHVVE